MISGCTNRPAADASAQEVTIRRTDAGYVASEGSDTVFVYHDEVVHPERPHARAHYVHPLFGLNGEMLTEDFPGDHLHQHGVYWGWHQVYVGGRRVGDQWTQEDVEWQVRNVEVLEDESSLRATVLWISTRHTGADGQPEPFVEETSTFRVYPRAEGHRAIDVTIEMRALVDSVQIGGSEDEKGYGGFSARIRLPEDVRFAGPDGPVQPEVTAVAAGPWVDISATYDESPSGLAVLQHPSNPGYPQPWILRREDSMQNVRWPGAEPITLPQDEPVTLRYRLIIHEGGSDAVPLERLHARYTSES